MSRRLLTVLATVSVLALAACDSAEERAEAHFQRSVELFQGGDVARAVIELRNVFQLDAAHRDARELLARIEEERGNLGAAYAQYRALTESAPEDTGAQRAAARLAAELGDWDAAERHADAAAGEGSAGDPDPVVASVRLTLAYQEARRGQDLAQVQSVAREAAALVSETPELVNARRILIDSALMREDWEGLLDHLEAVLAQRPHDRSLYMLRLAALEKLGRLDDLEAQLRDMVDRFPEDESFAQLLIRWYVSQDRAGDAEAFLRAQIDPQNADPGSILTLIAFLNQVRGPEEAQAEADRMLAAMPGDDPKRAVLRSTRASLDFDMGRHAEAIAQMQDILEGAEPSEATNRIRITLARMLVREDNPVGARALVEEVLAADPGEVEALKMLAAWMIEDDQPDQALIELRQALDEAPRDPAILTLMASAHERAGSRELMGEMLALAVDAAGNAPEETLRYARYLVAEDRLRPAEEVLLDALRLRGDDVRLLDALGNLYIRMQDWGRLQGVIDALDGIAGPTAAALVDELTARRLAAQNREDELQTYLEQLALGGGGDMQATLSVVRLRVSQGDVAGALGYIRERLAEDPDNPDLRLLEANTLALDDQAEAAETILRDLVAAAPQDERAWLALHRLLRRTGAAGEARAVLDAALENLPDSANLKWGLAGELEQGGDIEGAIAIYEDLYEQNSNSLVVANNLASLISSYREDEESLQRAYAIARRLRGTEVAPFQDTYGWIAARLGNHAEALEYLEPAAAALPGDPTVRYHLARTYAMAGRPADALAAYQETLRLVEESGRTLSFQDEVRAEIDRLQAAQPAEN